MPKYLIEPHALHIPSYESDSNEPKLKVSEIFYDTVQGEGEYTGYPAMFIRLAGCPVACKWCDTTDVWSHCSEWKVSQLARLFQSQGLVDRLDKGHHLILTGGSPLLQQKDLLDFIYEITSFCKNKPFIELENECSQEVREREFFFWVDCWNNSPKLSTAGSSYSKRYNPAAFQQIIKYGKEFWFKFVISLNKKDAEREWSEICDTYMKDGVERNKIILMPLGSSCKELTPEKRRFLAEFAIEKGVRYCERLQINLYDKSCGV